jgi:flagellar hook-associated protein 3 FlgL
MRISTAQIASAGIREILQRQADIQYTQLQLSTQLRVLKPSDDPVAATAIGAFVTEISRLEQYNFNANAAKASNELEESTLSGVTDVLFRVRELMVSLGNGAFGAQEFTGIGIELKENLLQIIGLANTQDSNGDFLFSGSKITQQSFTLNSAGNIVYNGDQSQRLLRISNTVVEPISDSGFDVFTDIKNGNSFFTVASPATNTGTAIISSGSYQTPPNFLAEAYSITFGIDLNGDTTYAITGDTSGLTIVAPTLYVEGSDISFNGITVSVSGTPDPANPDVLNIAPSQSQSVFSVIQSAIDAIEGFSDTEAGRAALTNAITTVQESLERSSEHIDLTRARIGARLNTIDSEINFNLSAIITNKTSLSDIRDLDFVEASSRFAQQLTVLEAAQASFVRVQNLSLFNFL